MRTPKPNHLILPRCDAWYRRPQPSKLWRLVLAACNFSLEIFPPVHTSDHLIKKYQSSKMIRRFVPFFALAAAARSADATAPSFLPKPKSVAATRALELRGGAGPIDAETAAKVVGGIAITTGSVFTVADKFCLKAYDVEGEYSPTDARNVVDHNLSILSAGLVMYSLLFRKDISWNRHGAWLSTLGV